MSTLADRAKGTAFEILYVVRVEPELTKEERRRISQRDSHRRAAALRKAKALKALTRPRATVNKDRYNAARYAARVGKAVGPVEIKTRWVGVNARLTGPKRPEQEYANGTN